MLVIELVLQTLTRYVASRPQPADEQPEDAKARRRTRLSPILVRSLCGRDLHRPIDFLKLAAALYLVLAIPSVVLAGTHGRLLRRSHAT